MSTTLLPPAHNGDSDDHFNLKPKKEKTIKPIHDEKKIKQKARSNQHKSKTSPTRKKTRKKPAKATVKKSTPANGSLLDELREKTAQLADKVKGEKLPQTRTLDLRSNNTPGHTTSIKDEIKALSKSIETSAKETKQKAAKTARAQLDSNPAVNVIRQKLERIYRKEPDAAEEAVEAYLAGGKRSKHQQYMYDLSTSSKSLSDIQNDWHTYYAGLPEHEKHEVWREFYESQGALQPRMAPPAPQQQPPNPKPSAQKKSRTKKLQPDRAFDPRSVKDIKHRILKRVGGGGGKLTAMQHVKSLVFGLGVSVLALLLVSFVFFNEAYIAPFISPGRTVSATPIIGQVDSPVGSEPKIIIPKINLEVPVVFGMSSIAEQDVQNALEDGVVHYASSPNPGEIGNSVIVGHSSNNLFNAGKYKFAFVLLKRLETEDTFFVHKDGVRYTYKVYEKEIVPPNDLSVLQTQERPNTMTLITCDPPGTSINRLIVYAEQISPDPAQNSESTAIAVQEADQDDEQLPSNAPSLWSRINPFD